MTDNRALRIVFDTYWSSTGWKRVYTISPESFTYAQNAGYMFQPTNLTHDDLVNWLKLSFKDANLKNISNAFLISLSTRQLELRSALGSFAIAKNFPAHVYQGKSYCCTICGAFKKLSQPYDLSMLNFERFKWGGVRHERHIAFDLDQFAKLDNVEPTDRDFDFMRQIVEVVRKCEPHDKPRDLEKKLANVLKSNKAERETLIQILAYCGILQPSKRSGYFQSFTNYFERDIPSVNKIDWAYPICRWRGIDGVNQDALKYYFPQLA